MDFMLTLGNYCLAQGHGDSIMRMDDMPESSNVEDRRGEGGGYGGGGMGMPMGAGGLGIGGVIVLGIIGWALGTIPVPDEWKGPMMDQFLKLDFVKIEN